MNPRLNPFKRTFQEPPTQGGFRMVTVKKDPNGRLSNKPEKDRTDRVISCFLYPLGIISLIGLISFALSIIFS